MSRNLWLAILLTLLPSGLRAQRQPGTPPDSTDAVPVFKLGAIEVIVGRMERTPGAIFIRAETLDAHERRDLSKALELLPGITPSGVGSRNEATVMVRGFDLRQVPVFMDGVPVYVPYDGYVDLGRFTTFDAAEIRVSRGFSSVLFGPNAMGGAINVLSRQPAERLELNAGTGLYSGGGREAYINVGGRFTSGYLQASWSVLKQDEFPLPSGRPSGFRANSDRRDVRSSLKVGWTPNDRSEIALALFDQSGRKGNPPYAGSDPNERVRYWRWPEWDKSGLSLTARSVVGAGLSLQGRAYYDTFDNTLLSFDDDTYTTQTRGYAFSSYYDDYTFGGSFEAALTGLEAHLPRMAVHFKEDVHRAHDEGSPVQTFRDRTLSLGLEHTWRLAELVSVVAGASIEGRETLRADNLVSGAIEDFATGDGTSFNPQIGVFRDLGGGTARATISRKTRFPTIKDRYSYRLGSAIPNPDLGSERATHFEIGYSGSTSGFSVDAALFAVEIDDLIQQVDSVALSEAGDDLWQLRNVGQARRFGADIGVEKQLSASTAVGVQYSYLHHENLLDEDLHIVGVPSHRFFGHLEFEPTAWLTAIGSVDASGRRFGSSGGFELDGYAVLSLRSTVRPKPGIEVGIGVQNLTDSDFELTPGFPEPGRTLSLRVSYDLRRMGR